MPGTADLVLFVHLHLPAGGTPAELARVWSQRFEPMVAALHHAPDVRVGLVLSGDLIPYLQERHPEALAWVRTLVSRGQAELVGAALYNPVLSAIPEADAVGQLDAHATLVRKVLGPRPTGAWLPQGVWDASVPRVLRAAQLDWVVVSDRHLEAAGVPRGEVTGVYRTERAGHVVALLPVDSRVDEVIAVAPVRRVLAHLRGRAAKGHGLIVLAVRADRFEGVDVSWFTTLLAGLGRLKGLRTVCPSAAVAASSSRGLIYLPSGGPTSTAPWQRVLVERDAANRLHKRVIRVSRLVSRFAQRSHDREATPPDPAAVLQAQRYLFRAQSTDVLTYGPDGGVYDRARRALAWKDALRAEQAALAGMGADDRTLAECLDVDCDGVAEVLLRSSQLTALVDPARSGGLVELSDARVHRNLVDTFTRRPESGQTEPAEPTDLTPAAQAPAPPPARLITDDFARAGFTEKILGEHETIRTLREGHAVHLVPAMAREPWRVVSVDRGPDETLACTLAWEGELPDGAGGAVPVTVRKRYTLRRDLLALRYELENRGAVAARARLALSLDLAAGSDAQVDVEGVAVDAGATRDCGRAQMVTVSDHASRVEVRLLEPTHLWLTPVLTAHRRFGEWREEVQALCLTWVLRLSVAPGETRRVDVKLRAYATTPPTPA